MKEPEREGGAQTRARRKSTFRDCWLSRVHTWFPCLTFPLFGPRYFTHPRCSLCFCSGFLITLVFRWLLSLSQPLPPPPPQEKSPSIRPRHCPGAARLRLAKITTINPCLLFVALCVWCIHQLFVTTPLCYFNRDSQDDTLSDSSPPPHLNFPSAVFVLVARFAAPALAARRFCKNNVHRLRFGWEGGGGLFSPAPREFVCYISARSRTVLTPNGRSRKK